MGYQLTQSSTTRPITFALVLAADHTTPATGKTPTVLLSKNGAAFGAAAGAVTEIGNGLYSVAGNATDSNTLGPLWIYVTASGCDAVLDIFEVVTHNPSVLNLDLILADTNELQTDWANGGRLDLLLDASVANALLAKQILGNKHTVVESPAGTFTISVRNDADDATVRTIVYIPATGARTVS